jgi:hypothetical protein
MLSAITALFSNKNPFNAILEPCFFNSILKKTVTSSHILPSVPRGTISGLLKRTDHRGHREHRGGWPVKTKNRHCAMLSTKMLPNTCSSLRVLCVLCGESPTNRAHQNSPHGANLPLRLIQCDAYRCRQVQAPRVGLHGDCQTRLRIRPQQRLRQSTGLPAEN